MGLIECVANISEGKDSAVLDHLKALFDNLDATLLHVDSGRGADRSVFTFAGPASTIARDSLIFAGEVISLVKVTDNEGVHPRIGSLDVCPFVALSPEHEKSAINAARSFAQLFFDKYGIPVFYYGALAGSREREALNFFRRGGIATLKHRMRNGLKADIGEKLHPVHGGTLVTARPLMVACNITLDSTDLHVAKKIASMIRHRSSHVESLSGLEAIGWYIEEYNAVQVSTNMRDTVSVTLPVLFNTVHRLAAAEGVSIRGTEVIGLIPAHALFLPGEPVDALDKTVLDRTIEALGLSEHSYFDPDQRVLELCLRNHGVI